MRMISSIVLLGCLSTACGERPQSPGADGSADPSSEAPVLSSPYAKQQRAVYEARIEAILDEYKKRAESLKLAARGRGPKFDEATRPALSALEAKTAAAALALENLKSASSESWQDHKAAVHAALDGLETSYDVTVSHLKELTGQPQTVAQGGV